MSWNNQGGGPWRSPGQGPWGQGPGGSPPPSDLEELLRRIQQGLRGIVPGGGGGGFGPRGFVLLALAALLIWFALGTFYSVQPNEVGINLVFGRYTGKTAAGLNTNWPWPVGAVIKVPVWDQQITDVGYRGGPEGADILAESQMLTGDQNIVNVRFRVIWQIDPAHPEYFVFNILNPQRDRQSRRREHHARSRRPEDNRRRADQRPQVDRAGRARPHAESARGLQRRRPDQAGAAAVGRRADRGDSAYRDVTAAQQDQQRAVNDADTYANRVVPEAEGAAARILAEAKAYREQTILQAKGQTARYNQIYAQYKNAPGVTRERIYLETMERVLGSMNKTILDASGASAPVPYIAVEPLQQNPAGAAK